MVFLTYYFKYVLEVKEEIIKLLQMYKRDFPDKCLSVHMTLSQDLSNLFSEI